MIKFVIMLADIKKAVLSGIMISVGGAVYLSCIAKGYTWLGAILFAAGLYTICEYGFNLYTGKVGYIAFRFTDFSYIWLVLLVLICNLLTTFLLGILLRNVFPLIKQEAEKIYAAKLTVPYWKSFVSGIFCGLLMFLSVDTWKRGSKIGCFIYIPVFILCGFDHSIANSLYNGIALGEHTFTVQNLLFILTVIAGNAAGGMTVPLLTRGNQNETQVSAPKQ